MWLHGEQWFGRSSHRDNASHVAKRGELVVPCFEIDDVDLHATFDEARCLLRNGDLPSAPRQRLLRTNSRHEL